jgi:methylated-DNA-[protein]-cysteine S-methyltransferase
MHLTASLDTPIGRLWVTLSRLGLVAIERGDLPPTGAEVDEAALSAALGELRAYFAGELRGFGLDLDLAGVSAFDADVYRAAQTIPYGATVSYGELAMMAGHPGAARAVGGAMARCPFAPVVPCHRVIHADGGLGGWGSESWVKRWLLDLEGARPRS